MPRKGQLQKYRKVAPAKPVGPERMARVQSASGLQRYLDEHLEWLAVTHYSPETVRTRRQAIGRFIAWMDERGIDVPSQISRPMIERYQKYLFYYRKPNGQPLSVGMQGQYLAALKLWFKWLTKAHHIGANPASDLDLPRTPKRLPGKILNQTQVQAMLAQADPVTAGGLRDRALLELLYASGIRRSEAAKLGVYDIDGLRGLLWVRCGKGGKDRVVPLGGRAMAWLDKYLTEARPELLAADTQALFISDYGQPLRADQIADKVRRYMRFAGLSKGGATHLLRHACATHMHEGGADIRFIQAMLGHTSLESTEIYTHVSIGKLIEVHQATHPSRLERVKTAQEDASQAAQGPSPQSAPNTAQNAAQAALLADLAQEDET